jgi:hypothetical protein
MTARPPEGATFEISRIGRSRSRAPLAALLWTVALVGLVGVGAIGRGPERPDTAAIAGTAWPGDAAPAIDVRTSQPRSALGMDLAQVHAVDLRLPGIGPVTLNEARLTVFGKVLVRATHIEISLEARNNRVLESINVEVSDPDGGIRPGQQPQFEAQFPLPFPRPNGTMWVVVTAYDATGIPLGGERRPFLVGAIIQPRLRILDFRDN